MLTLPTNLHRNTATDVTFKIASYLYLLDILPAYKDRILTTNTCSLKRVQSIGLFCGEEDTLRVLCDVVFAQDFPIHFCAASFECMAELPECVNKYNETMFLDWQGTHTCR